MENEVLRKEFKGARLQQTIQKMAIRPPKDWTRWSEFDIVISVILQDWETVSFHDSALEQTSTKIIAERK